MFAFGKVDTCIQWSKHFFLVLGKKTVQIFRSKICYKIGHCYSDASRVNRTIIVKKTCSTKEGVEAMVRTEPSLENRRKPAARPRALWYLKELSSKDEEKHKWLSYGKTRDCTVEAWDEACWDYKRMQDKRRRVGGAWRGKGDVDRLRVQVDPTPPDRVSRATVRGERME